MFRLIHRRCLSSDSLLGLVVLADKIVDFPVQFKVLLAIMWFGQENLAKEHVSQMVRLPK